MKELRPKKIGVQRHQDIPDNTLGDKWTMECTLTDEHVDRIFKNYVSEEMLAKIHTYFIPNEPKRVTITNKGKIQKLYVDGEYMFTEGERKWIK